MLQLAVTCHLVCHLSQALVDLLLQLSYSAFACIVLDDAFQGSLVEADFLLLLVKTVVLQFRRYQVALGYFYLFLGNVSAHFYQLHTVEQWAWDASQVIGCCDEENLREVVVGIQIVVVEGVVLFRVQHFEQSRCRVALEVVLAHLVYLVEDEDRVAAASLLDVLDDASWHGSDIGAAMTAYFCLVVQTAQ